MVKILWTIKLFLACSTVSVVDRNFTDFWVKDGQNLAMLHSQCFLLTCLVMHYYYYCYALLSLLLCITISSVLISAVWIEIRLG